MALTPIKLTPELLQDMVAADQKGLLFGWHAGVNENKCDMCHRQRGDIVLSICDEDYAGDEASGVIILLGTSCFRKLQKQLGLRVRLTAA